MSSGPTSDPIWKTQQEKEIIAADQKRLRSMLRPLSDVDPLRFIRRPRRLGHARQPAIVDILNSALRCVPGEVRSRRA
jgi:hypothetical protein